MDWTSYNQGQADAGLSKSLSKLSQSNTLAEALRRERYVAGGLENVAANRTRSVKAWDNIIWEIVQRIKDFDPETRYRILGVCKGQDATPEDTLRELRKVQEAWYAKLRKEAPKNNSDTDIPMLRNKWENDNV